jgi:hypothetical protein
MDELAQGAMMRLKILDAKRAKLLKKDMSAGG